MNEDAVSWFIQPYFATQLKLVAGGWNYWFSIDKTGRFSERRLCGILISLSQNVFLFVYWCLVISSNV